MTSAEPPAELRRAAQALFGDRLERAHRYAHLLSYNAVGRGLIGPREAGSVWPRHILNCAVVEELVPRDARTVDVAAWGRAAWNVRSRSRVPTWRCGWWSHWSAG
jgi:16S rRNA (guanine527-N7)-methyltransferase